MLEITYRKSPLRILRRMQSKAARQIQERILAIAEDPAGHDADVRSLTNRPGFRLRVGDWRVIFSMDDATLDVLVIKPRGDIYK
jgi:mRNA interferase RelE/StbE